MNNQLKKGVLEMAILGILTKESLHGYAVVQQLENYIKIKESSVYIILARLTQNNYLQTEMGLNGSRKVKFYILSNEGHVYYKELLAQWQEINVLVNDVCIKENDE